MIIYLIRHGQSAGNLLGNKYSIITGRKDNSSLTKKGKDQIKKIAFNFKNKNINIKKIYTSPLKRTFQSALIFKKFYTECEIKVDERLTEINFGEIEGKTWQEVKNKYSLWLNQYLKDRFNTAFPNGESRKDLCQRIKSFIQEEIESASNSILIITHEETIRAFLYNFVNERVFFDRKKIPQITNSSITSIWSNKKDSLVFQINDDNPLNLNENQIKRIFKFLRENNINPLFVQRQKSYSDNLVFTLVTKNSKKYLLKLTPSPKRNQIKKEVFLSRYFKKINLPSPLCLKIKKEKKYIFKLRQFFDDKLAEYYLQDKKFSAKIAKFMGSLLKKIHFLTKDLKKEREFIKLAPIYQKTNWLNDFLKNWLKKDLETLERINYSKREIIKDIYYQYLKNKSFLFNEGFIYFDFHPQNFTVRFENNQFILTALWDFENAFWGDVFFDIAYTIKLSFFKNQKLINNFLKGYFFKNISKNQKEQIFFYLLIITTGSITYKKEKKLQYDEEIKNLDWFLKRHLKFIAAAKYQIKSKFINF